MLIGGIIVKEQADIVYSCGNFNVFCQTWIINDTYRIWILLSGLCIQALITYWYGYHVSGCCCVIIFCFAF